ncbi:DUF1413 domain-containing protein [Staphylococcus aureus]
MMTNIQRMIQITYEQKDDFKKLKNRILGISINLPEGQTFTFHEFLTVVQMYRVLKQYNKMLGYWFAYFVKHAPRVPFIIIGKNTNGDLSTY